MGNWAEIPKDLLILIAKRLTLFEDFLDFSGVCRSWRSVAINYHFKGSEKLPCLMLSDNDKPDDRQFVSLRKGGVIRTVNLPEARGKRCLESSGCLVTISEDGDMSLLHSFTRSQINLPHVTTFKIYDWHSMENHLTFIQKVVLSSSPQESKDYVLVVAYTWSGCLAFWKPGDKCWTNVEVCVLSFCDIIFHKGLFYGVIGRGMVFAFDAWGSNPTKPWFVRHGPQKYMGRSSQDYMGGNDRPYIVESAGVVLMICPEGKDDYRVGYRMCGFEVFEVDLSGRLEYVEKLSLGNYALFLSDNASVSVEESRFSEIKGNCIYYTGNFCVIMLPSSICSPSTKGSRPRTDSSFTIPDLIRTFLARRVLALLAFLLSSPSVIAQSEHDWRAAPHSWERGPSLDSIVVRINVAIFLLVLLSICVCVPMQILNKQLWHSQSQ